MGRPMRLIFMGSPDFAVPCLDRLVTDGHTVALVATQPDRPAGRGRDLRPPPVKLAAARHRLPLTQPERLNDPVTVDTLRAIAPRDHRGGGLRAVSPPCRSGASAAGLHQRPRLAPPEVSGSRPHPSRRDGRGDGDRRHYHAGRGADGRRPHPAPAHLSDPARGRHGHPPRPSGRAWEPRPCPMRSASLRPGAVPGSPRTTPGSAWPRSSATPTVAWSSPDEPRPW